MLNLIRYWQGDLKPDVVDFMKKNYPPWFTYAEFASMFTAEFFDPDYWADLFQESGAKYMRQQYNHFKYRLLIIFCCF